MDLTGITVELMAKIILLPLVFSLLSLVYCQTIFKCSPVNGSLETYSFNLGSDSGIACVYGQGTENMIMYVEKLQPSGERKIGVAATKYSAKLQNQVGHMYSLFPPGPKRRFTARTQPGFIVMDFGDGESIELNLRPDGLAWVPADIRQISGCAMETPQIFMDVLDQKTMQNSKMMLCAMGHKPGSGYKALYGFGMRSNQSIGMEPFIFLGQSINPIIPSAPLNIIANLFDVCIKADCKQCAAGYKSLTLSN